VIQMIEIHDMDWLDDLEIEIPWFKVVGAIVFIIGVMWVTLR